MIEQAPFVFNEREWDRGLWRMVIVSGVLHLIAIALVLFLPYSFAHHPPPMISYTVDLVAPDKVGGTNVVAGGKGRVEGAPLVAARPAPKVEPPKVAPKLEEAKPPEPKAEVPKAEVLPPQPEKPKEVASKPQPLPAEVKPESKAQEPPKLKQNEAALAAPVKKVEPITPPSPAKPAAAPKEVAKAEPAKAAPPAPSKAEIEAAKKAAAEAAAAQQRDERILAAVKRAEKQTGARGGGSGQRAGDTPGGPVSAGPGQGAGGQFMGVEYILYYNTLNTRLRDNWAWAGTDAALEALIYFRITETGEIADVRITQSSGDPSFDKSVERAVKAINPMPPPPEAYRKKFGEEGVEMTFNLKEMQK